MSIKTQRLVVESGFPNSQVIQVHTLHTDDLHRVITAVREYLSMTEVSNTWTLEAVSDLEFPRSDQFIIAKNYNTQEVADMLRNLELLEL